MALPTVYQIVARFAEHTTSLMRHAKQPILVHTGPLKRQGGLKNRLFWAYRSRQMDRWARPRERAATSLDVTFLVVTFMVAVKQIYKGLYTQIRHVHLPEALKLHLIALEAAGCSQALLDIARDKEG